MLEFRPRVPARSYLSRREQLRLFGWVMGIGLVVIACTWLSEFDQLVRAQPDATVPTIDTRFRTAPEGARELDSVTILKPAGSALPGERDQSDAEVNAALLSEVRDDTPWIRSEEVDAWLNVWSVLRRSSDEELERHSAGNVGFVELFGQPVAYRGKLVTIRGSARQAMYLEAAKNAEGIEGYYRVVILPEGGPAEPVFVYALQLPYGFPVGDNIRAEVAATGFFFKRMVYATQDTALRRAPVIMARTLVWQRPSTQIAQAEGAFLGILAGVTVLGVVVFFVISLWASRTGASATAHRPETLSAFDDRNVVGVDEALARLAEKQE